MRREGSPELTEAASATWRRWHRVLSGVDLGLAVGIGPPSIFEPPGQRAFPTTDLIKHARGHRVMHLRWTISELFWNS
jgi:hypothetical protein